MVRVQVPEPEQSPLQPLNTLPAEEAAERETTVPVAYPSEQSVPQLMPGIFEVTVPEAVPVTETVSGA